MNEGAMLMIRKIGKIVILLAVLLVAYTATISPEYSISREILVKASPEKVFPLLNSSRKANEWMPWAESDPKMTMSYSGPEEGVGSTASWESTGQMGVGKAEIVESTANRSVKTQLTYIKPMEMSQLAEISLTPASEGTVVKWSVAGRNGFICRMVCVFMNMDKMVGGEFEKGLKKLKEKVEA